MKKDEFYFEAILPKVPVALLRAVNTLNRRKFRKSRRGMFLLKSVSYKRMVNGLFHLVVTLQKYRHPKIGTARRKRFVIYRTSHKPFGKLLKKFRYCQRFPTPPTVYGESPH